MEKYLAIIAVASVVSVISNMILLAITCKASKTNQKYQQLGYEIAAKNTSLNEENQKFNENIQTTLKQVAYQIATLQYSYNKAHLEVLNNEIHIVTPKADYKLEGLVEVKPETETSNIVSSS